MKLRSLQFPIASFGAILVAWAIYSIFGLFTPAYFGDGNRLIFLYGVTATGFLFLAGGLAISPSEGVGVRFNQSQRRLFGLAIAGSVGMVLFPMLVLPITHPGRVLINPEVMMAAIFIPATVAGLAPVIALIWRLIEAV
jgi:hypothetical protein